MISKINMGEWVAWPYLLFIQPGSGGNQVFVCQLLYLLTHNIAAMITPAHDCQRVTWLQSSKIVSWKWSRSSCRVTSKAQSCLSVVTICVIMIQVFLDTNYHVSNIQQFQTVSSFLKYWLLLHSVSTSFINKRIKFC